MKALQKLWDRKRVDLLGLIEIAWLMVNPWAVPSVGLTRGKPCADKTAPADVASIVEAGDYDPRLVYLLASKPVREIIDYDRDIEHMYTALGKAPGNNDIALAKSAYEQWRSCAIRARGC